jgi:hypothetical protein
MLHLMKMENGQDFDEVREPRAGARVTLEPRGVF